MRVGLRRLRSVLKVFRPAAGCPAVQEFDAGLKALADRLGPARDWDVFLGGLGAEVAAACRATSGSRALLKAGEAKRQAAYAALRAELDGVGFRRLVLAGLGLLLQRPWRAAEAAERRRGWTSTCRNSPPRCSTSAGASCATEGEDIEDHAAEALHEVRLEAKRLRYATELFAPLWPGKATRRFQRRLAALQEELGRRQRHRGGARPGRLARRRRAGLGGRRGGGLRHRPRGRCCASDAIEAWEDLMVAGPSWSRP